MFKACAPRHVFGETILQYELLFFHEETNWVSGLEQRYHTTRASSEHDHSETPSHAEFVNPVCKNGALHQTHSHSP